MAGAVEFVGVSPPPAGRTPNLVNPETTTRSNAVFHAVMLSVVTVCVCIRIYTRVFITKQIGLDDYICLFGFCLLVTFSALLLVEGEYSLGHHMWDITYPAFVHGTKLNVFASWIYIVLSASIKLSCLFFYRRLFMVHEKMLRSIHGGIAAISAVHLVLLNTSILYCQPVHKHWDPRIPGGCLPSGSLFYTSGAFNVAGDIFVVFLPLPALWYLHMPPAKKARIMAVFGLGIITVAMSITRLVQTPLAFTTGDGSWELSRFNISSSLEMYFGMICACLLAFPAFIETYGPRLTSRLRSCVVLRHIKGERRPTNAEEAGSKCQRNFRNSGDGYMNLSHGIDLAITLTSTPEERNSVGYSEERTIEETNHADIV